ncbi:MAG TPA: bifunctional phosphoribosylaminoimidazolecarboxamide formyltransferase/IMP cyclohydrolase [Acidobacteriota bacterium]|nr:bifunctional phosphoribosylaminoimidazolecarboxamide formyltransferase/IMP cyclohydrolase [Acidobacteriota bacterium]
MGAMRIQTALISVSDKSGVGDLAEGLHQRGIRILSTGGTARLIEKRGVPVTAVSQYTGSPEILGGRVKTLHPKIHGGILARHGDEGHRQVLQDQGIDPIGLVVVNLYPFSETIARRGVRLEEAVEQIDIGGPTLLRAAAKNHESVTVVVDPGDYGTVLSALDEGEGETRLALRKRLALKAFQHTAAYDAAIAAYLAQRGEADQAGGDSSSRASGESSSAEGQAELPEALALGLSRQASLRYGENPHQRAALYRFSDRPPAGVVAAKQLQGKTLSFNNYLDLQAAWDLGREFEQPSCVIVKHNNPCGVAQAESPCEAYRRALECDSLSAFGSIIAFNRQVDAETAQAMRKLFVEAVIAPAYEADALEVFSAKKNLRVMLADGSPPDPWQFKKVDGGFLVQDADLQTVSRGDLKTVTQRVPSESELDDLLFAWRVCKHVKSNAIVYAKDGRTVGIGAGQMSRVDSVILAARKAKLHLEGAVMASDAFFPFRDGVDEAAKAGIAAVIQPGGSKRDDEVIEACDEHGMAMVLTSMRHFRH